jgi:alanyl-tRNA synthetase
VVYLDRTAFYPSSGGQPFDTGVLGGVQVEEVIDEGDEIAHRLERPIESGAVNAEVDWKRRFDHMQQHSGQHLLSAVLVELFGWETVSVHIGSTSSTIELATPSVESRQVVEAEQRAAELITENRAVRITSEDAAAVRGLRKETGRTGAIRIVSIEGLDRSACGGTHVRATGEIGCVLLRGTEKIRGNVRLEFLCGGRAVARSRAEYGWLSEIARFLSAPVENTPAVVEKMAARVEESEKARRKLSAELATLRGRSLYNQTNPTESGMRTYSRAGVLGDDLRAEAQAFTAQPKSSYIAWQESPAAVLVACSADSGKHAGNVVKEVISAYGGRGGGSATLAQSNIPPGVSVEDVVNAIRSRLE